MSLEKISSWQAEEDGGEYYRVEDVRAMIQTSDEAFAVLRWIDDNYASVLRSESLWDEAARRARSALVHRDLIGGMRLVSGTVAGDNLDVVEGQANGEGQGIGFDDADLGGVEPGIGDERTGGSA